MTHDEMKAAITAFQEGKKMEWRARNSTQKDWRDVVGSPLWDFAGCDYRVKPEPRRCFRNQYRNRLGEFAYDTREEATAHANADSIAVIEFVEVVK